MEEKGAVLVIARDSRDYIIIILIITHQHKACRLTYQIKVAVVIIILRMLILSVGR